MLPSAGKHGDGLCAPFFFFFLIGGVTENWRPLTCRLMKLDVVSEDVLPSERLKRLLRLGNFLGSYEQKTNVAFFFNVSILNFIKKKKKISLAFSVRQKGRGHRFPLRARKCACVFAAGPVD